MRIAHISDLHFSKLSKNPAQFFSKAWLGNANLLFNRSYDFSTSQPHALISALKKHQVTDVIITGDLTTTSSHAEFRIAKEYVERLKREELNVYLVPGNHDHYTKTAYRKKRFYRYFQTSYGTDVTSTLDKEGLTAKKLFPNWWLVLMDTTLATSLYSANGHFSPKLEENLLSLLNQIPSNDSILLVNHFPFFLNEKPRRHLLRGDALQALLKQFPNIQLYLHGHTHRRCIADLRKNGLPIILDSGSTSFKKGSWNLIELSLTACTVQPFTWENETWMPQDTHQIRMNHEQTQAN